MNNPYQAPNAAVELTMINCKGCAKEVHVQATACPNCGLSQRSRGYKSKNLAGVFAMVLGAFGVHRFYLGQWWGVFYLLTFWTGIPSVVSFVEAFVFWFADVRKWDNKYNEGKAAGPTEKAGAGTIVLLVAVFAIVGIAVLGILAAIAIPAYSDYTVRAKVGEALAQSSPAKVEVLNYYEKNQALPASNQDLGFDDVNRLPSKHLLEVNDGELTITFAQNTGAIDGDTIVLVPVDGDYGVEWDCTGGSLKPQYRPSICRPE